VARGSRRAPVEITLTVGTATHIPEYEFESVLVPPLRVPRRLTGKNPGSLVFALLIHNKQPIYILLSLAFALLSHNKPIKHKNKTTRVVETSK
jgi:hypothetical protein